MPDQIIDRTASTYGALSVGQHILHFASPETPVVAEVASTLPFKDGNGTPVVFLTLIPVGEGEPVQVRHPAAAAVDLATDVDVAKALDHHHYRRVALRDVLRRLGDDIVANALPLPPYGLEFGGCIDTLADATAWARYLGVKVRGGGPDSSIPVADLAMPYEAGGVLLKVKVQAMEEMPTEPEPVVDPEPTQVDLPTPRYPEGTPEYAAYAAELGTELGKFARGEEPYPDTTPADR